MAAVQVKGPQSNWESLRNLAGALWETPNAPAPPLDVRVQDSNGATVRFMITSRGLDSSIASSTLDSRLLAQHMQITVLL